MPGFGFGFGFMSLSMILLTLFCLALIVLAVWAVIRLFPRDQRSDHAVALELLRRRYAAGEISEVEYQQALRTLG